MAREAIGYQKFWLGILVISDISLIGWLLSNFAAAPAYKTIAAIIAIVALTRGALSTHKEIERKIATLEDL